MNCFCHARDVARHRWGRIHLVDKCLLVILALLMLQAALNLFLNEANNQETSSIDVVIRTSAAGIFGYLVSANFNQQKKRENKKGATASKPTVAASTGTQGAVRGRIGFDTGGTEDDRQIADAPRLTSADGGKHISYDRSQVLVVAAVGVVSLAVLLIYRNFFPVSANSAGTLTQFRDFVSGSVGFLISCSTSASGAESE